MAATNATVSKSSVRTKFMDEDREFVPKKKEHFKKEAHKTMRYAQI